MQVTIQFTVELTDLQALLTVLQMFPVPEIKETTPGAPFDEKLEPVTEPTPDAVETPEKEREILYCACGCGKELISKRSLFLNKQHYQKHYMRSYKKDTTPQPKEDPLKAKLEKIKKECPLPKVKRPTVYHEC